MQPTTTLARLLLRSQQAERNVSRKRVLQREDKGDRRSHCAHVGTGEEHAGPVQSPAVSGLGMATAMMPCVQPCALCQAPAALSQLPAVVVVSPPAPVVALGLV